MVIAFRLQLKKIVIFFVPRDNCFRNILLWNHYTSVLGRWNRGGERVRVRTDHDFARHGTRRRPTQHAEIRPQDSIGRRAKTTNTRAGGFHMGRRIIP